MVMKLERSGNVAAIAKRGGLGILVLFLCLLTFEGALEAQGGLDENWIVEIDGRTAVPRENGSFVVRNVTASSSFGTGISDDCLRAIGRLIASPDPRYAYSEPFRITAGGDIDVGDLIYSDTPPPMVTDLFVSAGVPGQQPFLLAGQTLQLEVEAGYSDGSLIPFTGISVECGPTYRSSNPAILSVTESGFIEAQDSGFALASAFVTVRMEGITVTRNVVVASTATTTVVGSVIREDGSPAGGVSVSIPSQGLTALTDAISGAFSFPNVPSSDPDLRVIAEDATGAVVLRARSSALAAVPSALTDAGVLVLRALALEAGSTTLSVGQTGTVPVLLSSDQELAGLSFGLCPGAMGLQIDGATIGPGLSGLAGGAGPDLLMVDWSAAGVWMLVLVDLGPGPLETIPVGPGQELLSVDFTAVAGGGTTVPLCFCEGLGSPPVETLVVPIGGATSLAPGQVCGSVTITP